MSNELVNNAQEKAEEAVTAETPPEDNGTEAPARPVSEEEWVKKTKDKDKEEDVVRPVDELWCGASVYIKTEFTGPILGPVHTGSGHMYYDKAQRDEITVDVERVSRKDLAKIRKVYVASPTYDRAQRVLAEKHVLILSGQAHWGKWTTAIHLLSSLHAEDIFKLDPYVEPQELRSSELEPKRGYVIDTLVPDSAENLSTSVNRLSRRLRERHSHLVVTVDSRVPLSKEALSDYLVVWNDVPDRPQILEKHLGWYLIDKDMLARALELRQTDTVQQLLSTHLLPREVDCLAKLLAGVARHEFELEEALADFEAFIRQQVAAWFKGHPELEERIFMLSLAVFSGANEQVVIDADERLRSLIRSLTTEGESPLTDLLIGRTLSERLADACAHPKQGYEETEFGHNPVTLMVLDNPAFQPAVLHHAWHEYDRLRRHLLDWLHDLGFHPSFDVRARVAAAVGELSKYDFGYVRREVLLPWANDQDSRTRAAAALALGIPAWEGEFAPQVLGLLHHWSTLRNNWRLSWTAAAAYGGLVGLGFPDTALRDLHTIAHAEDLRLFGVISRSVANLFEAGRLATDYYLKVLDALIAWTADPKTKIATLTGLLIFLELGLEAKVEADPEGGAWPTLLWLARDDETYRDRVIDLWRRALNTKVARKLALEALHQWLLTVDDDTRLYLPIEQVIVTLATQGTEREKERLRFYLDRWASHPKQKSKSAAKVLSVLNGN